MKGHRFIFAVLLTFPLFARAQDKTVTLPQLLQDAQQWAQENLDTNVLKALPKLDDRAVQQFYLEIQQRFQGDYVVDLAGLKQTARAVLPWLESNEATQPYAAWLSSQMDYFDVADEIRLTIPPPVVESNRSRRRRRPIRRRNGSARFGSEKFPAVPGPPPRRSMCRS